MASTNTLELYVGGRIYTGFLSADIKRSIEDLSGTFLLTVSSDFSAASLEIHPTDTCEIVLNGETVVSGYVDRIVPSLTPTTHTISVSGRDKAADLVDCCVVASSGNFSNLKLEEIAKQICEPFGINVTVDVDTGLPLKLFAIDQGMTCFEALQKMAKIRRCLVCSDGAGGILITRAGTKAVATGLVEGINIEKGSAEIDYSGRHSLYICKGQQQSDSTTPIEQSTGAVGKAVDSSILRYRPLLIIAEGQATQQDCIDRAAWELSTRKGKSTRYTITTTGWNAPLTGGLWAVNQLITLNAPSLGVYDNLLIVSVNFKLDNDGGQVTTLELTPPAAYLTFDIDTSYNASNAFLTGA